MTVPVAEIYTSNVGTLKPTLHGFDYVSGKLADLKKFLDRKGLKRIAVHDTKNLIQIILGKMRFENSEIEASIYDYLRIPPEDIDIRAAVSILQQAALSTQQLLPVSPLLEITDLLASSADVLLAEETHERERSYYGLTQQTTTLSSFIALYRAVGANIRFSGIDSILDGRGSAVIANLLHNGVKFHQHTEPMHVSSDGSSRISITNSSETAVPDKPFNLYSRSTTASGGSGIGLFLAQMYSHTIDATISHQSHYNADRANTGGPPFDITFALTAN